MKKLYVSFKRKKSILKFLITLYSYKDDGCGATAHATFYDKECTKVHCPNGKWRGFDDIYALVKTYYPSTTKKKLMVKLMEMRYEVYRNGEKSYRYPHFEICSGAGILRVMPYRFESNTISTKKPTNSKYSWKELFGLLGIYTINDYNEYKKKHNLK